jgi:cytochrome b6-f complex iron-sulfur subunit
MYRHKVNQTMKQKNMNRGQFVRELGLSSAALMAFYCLGTATTSCTTDSPTPTPTPTPGGTTPTPTPVVDGFTGNADPSKAKVDFTIDLTKDTYKSLAMTGAFLNVGEVFIALTKDKKYIAVSKNCTHEGNPLRYVNADDNIKCDTHGSVFTTAGGVKAGPATKALVSYKTELVGDKLTVKE